MKKFSPLQTLLSASAILTQGQGWEIVGGKVEDDLDDCATCPECGKRHHPSYHDQEPCDDCTESLCEQIPCEILGCGKMASRAQMRIFRLGGAPVECCPACWDAMEIPTGIRDTAELEKKGNGIP